MTTTVTNIIDDLAEKVNRTSALTFTNIHRIPYTEYTNGEVTGDNSGEVVEDMEDTDNIPGTNDGRSIRGQCKIS